MLIDTRMAIMCTVDARPSGTRPHARARLSGSSPAVEGLEARQLLSFLNPFGSKFERIQSGGAVDVISVSGTGQVFTTRLNRKTLDIKLVGTSSNSLVTIVPLAARQGTLNSPLQIGRISVRTGMLASFQAPTTADLLGRMTPLTGPVNSLQFDAIGPAAQISVNGNLGQLTVNRNITLGPNGRIDVMNDLTGSFSVTGDVVLSGGWIGIGRDLTGTLAIGGSLMASNGGQFLVGRNLGATVSGAVTDSISGSLTAGSGGAFAVGGNLSALTVSGNIEASGGGQIAVGGNMGTLTVSGGGGTSATGNVTLATGSQITVSGNLGTFSVGSNLQTSGGGEIRVFGDLGNLSVTGIVQGKGSEDVVVGDDLGQLTVLGGGNNDYSLQGVDIDVAKSIQGVDVRNGITYSLISAGILINGGTPAMGSNGWNIGPDGTIAVFDSQILAGSEITNILIGGDVKSDLPENPSSGRVTRIVAGEDANGKFSAGGIIDKFQIVGRLIDAVLAASVQSYGGTGAEPPTPTPPNYSPPTSTSDDNGYKTYDEPAGTITVGAVTYQTFTAPPYDPSGDPTIDDLVYPGGAINPSFAPTLSSSPLPPESTVLGGVVSMPHGDDADFAGIFAANTIGVFVGPLPTS